MATSKPINPNGLAIVEALTPRKGEIFAFAEIASMAKVDAKTGYLTSAKKIASERNMTLEKVEGGVTAQVHTVTEYPNGLKVDATKEIVLDGYRLVDAE